MEYHRLCPFRYLTDYSLTPQDFIVPATSNYYRPWKWYNQAATKDFGSTIQHGKDKFKIDLDVQHFRPDEISVKASDKEIIIEGKHEERQDDNGFVSRQFKRRYALPKDFPSENVVSSLSSDGVLTVIADRRAVKGPERIVPVSFCGISTNKAIKESRLSTGITQKYIDDTIREANELIIKNKAHNLVNNEHSRLLKPEFMADSAKDNTKIEEDNPNDLPSTSTDKNLIFSVTSKFDESIKKQDIGTSSSAGLSASSSSEHQSMKTVSESIREESSSYKSSTIKKSGHLNDINEAISAELREAADNI